MGGGVVCCCCFTKHYLPIPAKSLLLLLPGNNGMELKLLKDHVHLSVYGLPRWLLFTFVLKMSPLNESLWE